MDPKEHAEKLVESAKAGLQKALASKKPLITQDTNYSALEMRLMAQMSEEDRALFLDRRAKIKARNNPNFHKVPKRPGPNEPCPCGRTNEAGKAVKFKKCCGSHRGDLYYFVADVVSNDPLCNDEGRVMVFRDIPTASAAAKAKGWFNDLERKIEVVSLTPEKFEDFKTKLPYVMVTAKEFDVGDKVEASAKPEDPSMGTMVPHEPCPDCSGEPCEHAKP